MQFRGMYCDDWFLIEAIDYLFFYKCTYPTVTSNMLLPIELERAISPRPFLATITLVMRSGILVPAARNVNPITCVYSELCNVLCLAYLICIISYTRSAYGVDNYVQ